MRVHHQHHHKVEQEQQIRNHHRHQYRHHGPSFEEELQQVQQEEQNTNQVQDNQSTVVSDSDSSLSTATTAVTADDLYQEVDELINYLKEVVENAPNVDQEEVTQTVEEYLNEISNTYEFANVDRNEYINFLNNEINNVLNPAINGDFAQVTDPQVREFVLNVVNKTKEALYNLPNTATTATDTTATTDNTAATEATTSSEEIIEAQNINSLEATISPTATKDNPAIIQVNNLELKVWYEQNPDGTYKVWFEAESTDGQPVSAQLELLAANGQRPEWVGGNPYTLQLDGQQTDVEYWTPVKNEELPVIIKLQSYKNLEPEAIIAKRSVVGYNVKTIVFGDKKVEVKIPVLRVTDIVDLKFGKYEGLFPDGTKIDLTVPAEAIHNKLDVKVEGKTETIEIENPGKPEKPSKKEFIDPSTGQLDKTAYKEALAEYKAQLKEYKEALKEFKAAVKEAKLEAKGEVKSLKVEEKAVKKVQKYLDKILKTAKKIDKYIKKAEAALDKAEDLREKAKEIRAEAEKRAEALLGSGWTMEQLEAKLQKPKKEDFVDPTTGQLDKEAYNKALAEYKEAKAIYKLFKKADKLELKADKLEAKADKYEAKAKDMAQKSLDKFYKGLEKLLTTYTNKANSLESKAQQLLEKAKELSGANYYKTLGKGLYDKELAQGYKRGAELTRAVLETYEKLDITKNPDASTLLKVVDIYKTNFKL
ncbi:MAG: hypothetical protein ABGX24_00735 [Aquificota bacterium]